MEYFIQFCFEVPLSAAQRTYAMGLAKALDAQMALDPLPEGYDDGLDAVRCYEWGGVLENTKCGVRVSSNSRSSVEGAIDFVRHLLRRYGLSITVSFVYAEFASHPCADGARGGARIVTKSNVTRIDAVTWLRDQLELKP